MKKKLRLFLTLCTLAFSMFVFCFGVYASVQVSYSISGTISYSVQKAYVEITTKVYKDDNKYDQATLTSKAQALENQTFAQIEELYGSAVQSFSTYNNLNESGTPSATNIHINYDEAFTYFIVISVKNLSSSVNIDISLVNNTSSGTSLNSVVFSSAPKYDVPKSDNVTNMVVAYSLLDLAQPTNVEFNYDLLVSMAQAGYTVTLSGGLAQYYAVDGENGLTQVTAGQQIVVRDKLLIANYNFDNLNLLWESSVDDIYFVENNEYGPSVPVPTNEWCIININNNIAIRGVKYYPDNYLYYFAILEITSDCNVEFYHGDIPPIIDI